MNSIAIDTFTGDWRAVVAEVQHTGEVAAITCDGTICGVLLPAQEAHRLAARYTTAEQYATTRTATEQPDELRTYLELLRDDPTLVPVIDGQPLEFVTMMNSSYSNPEQLYQFKHPTTRQISIYRSSELEQAIGRAFMRVNFIPQRPKDVVEGKQ